MGQSNLESGEVGLTRIGVKDLEQVAKELESIEIQLSVLSIQMKYDHSPYAERTMDVTSRLSEMHNLLEKILAFGT